MTARTLGIATLKFDPASIIGAIAGALAVIWAALVTTRQSRAAKAIDAQTAWQTNLLAEVTQLRTAILALEGSLDHERKLRRDLEDQFAEEKRITDSLRKQVGILTAERDEFRQKYEKLIRTIQHEAVLPAGWAEPEENH